MPPMPFNASPKFCTRLACTLMVSVSLTHYVYDPHPSHGVHHEAAHVLHVPEPDYSTDPTVNSAPAASGAMLPGHHEPLRRYGLDL